MLEKIFNSVTRAKLLKLFVHNPNVIFDSVEISKKLKLQPAPAKKELENLAELGIIEIVKERPAGSRDESAGSAKSDDVTSKAGAKKEALAAGKRYFRAKSDFILYNELKALIVKAQMLCEKDFIDKIRGLGRVKFLLLTGAFANCADSPIDIFLIGSINKGKFQELISELEAELGREIDYTIMSHGEFKYRRDMTDVFLYTILEGKKIIIIDEIDLFQPI